MAHQLSLLIPDEVYEPLLRQAQSKDQTVETLAGECLARAAEGDPRPGERLRRWAGAFASGVSDAGERHDEYIGQALYDELKGKAGD